MTSPPSFSSQEVVCYTTTESRKLKNPRKCLTLKNVKTIISVCLEDTKKVCFCLKLFQIKIIASAKVSCKYQNIF